MRRFYDRNPSTDAKLVKARREMSFHAENTTTTTTTTTTTSSKNNNSNNNELKGAPVLAERDRAEDTAKPVEKAPAVVKKRKRKSSSRTEEMKRNLKRTESW